MNWLQKIFNGKAPLSPSVDSRQFRYLYPYNYNAIWIDTDAHSYVQNGYMLNADLYSVINAITKPAGQVVWYVGKVKDQKAYRRYKSWVNNAEAMKSNPYRAMRLQEKAIEEMPNHPLQKLLDRPNKYTSWSNFVEGYIGYKRLTGNTYVWKNLTENGPNRGQVYEMIMLPAQFVIIEMDRVGGIAGYKLLYGPKEPIPEDQVLHSKYWNPDYTQDGRSLYGMSPIKAAERLITRSNAAYEFSTTMLQNMGPPGFGVTEESGPDTEKALKGFYKDWKTRFSGPKNANTPMILQDFAGFKWHQTGMTPTDAGLLESQKFDLRTMCNIHGINSILLNDPDNKTQANAKEARKALYLETIIPELNILKEDINRDIAPHFGEGIVADIDLQSIPELQENTKEQAEWLNTAWWIKGSDKQIAMGYEEDLEIDKYFIPANLIEYVPNAAGVTDEDIDDAMKNLGIRQ